MESVRAARKVTNVGFLVVSFALVGFIVYLLVTNYQSHLKLHESALERLRSITEKRAAALHYFYAERRNDFKDLLRDRSIAAFFRSEATDASDGRGLEANRLGIGRLFDYLLEDRRIGGEQVYTWILLVGNDGEMLIDRSLGNASQESGKNFERLLDPSHSGPRITTELEGDRLRTMISAPYYFKKDYKGQIVAYVSNKVVYEHLVKANQRTSMHFMSVYCDDRGHKCVSPDPPYAHRHNNLPNLKDLVTGTTRRFRTDPEEGAPVKMVSTAVPVRNTPFHLVSLSPLSEVLGDVTPGYLFIVMGLLSLFILAAMAYAVRVNTRNLVLEARLEEASTRRKEFEEKNRQLEEEIEKHRRTQEALKQSESRYRSLVENTMDGYFIVETDSGKVLFVNRRICRFFGYTPEEALELTLWDVISPENHGSVKAQIEKLNEGAQKTLDRYTPKMIRKDGSEFLAEISGSLVTFEGCSVIQGLLRDVTEQKRLERQLQQAQKMEAIGTLAGGIAHDFNNLIQAISGYAELLLLNRPSSDPDYKKLEAMQKSTRRASELTRQLLIFSRKVDSRFEVVDLNSEVKNVSELLKRTIPKMIDIKLHLAESLKSIYGDPVQLEQVMMNLGINARDAMPEGGELVIETGNVILDELYCRVHPGARPGEHVLVSVSDNGCGMDRKTLENIFAPFYTTKKKGKGTGLGLAMVYGIVKSHRGYIMCYSEESQGTTFKIYFPAINGKRSSQAQDRKDPLRGGNETILLVDDEEHIRQLVQEALSRFGYKVLTATDGESALDIYRSQGDQIDLLLLDLIMPGMGGHKCLEEILKTDPDAKVVIASGYSLNGPAKGVTELGAKGFLQKPYDLKKMLRRVRGILDEDEPESAR